MFISCVYLSGYANDVPLTGHTDIKTDHGQIQVQFNEAECRLIQEIVVGAYHRKSQELIRELQEKSPALAMLPPPAEEGEEAEFYSVSDDDTGVPF